MTKTRSSQLLRRSLTSPRKLGRHRRGGGQGWRVVKHLRQVLNEGDVHGAICTGDLLRAVGHLSTKITKWTRDCDVRLLRIMRYLKGSKEFRQWIYRRRARGPPALSIYRRGLSRRPERPQIDVRRLLSTDRHSQLLATVRTVQEANNSESQHGRG